LLCLMLTQMDGAQFPLAQSLMLWYNSSIANLKDST
jgi:hypothetical protein